MEKTGIGIIGCGRISYAHARGYGAIPRKARIIAACDVDGERGRKAKETWGAEYCCTDIEDLLKREDIDAVSICLPHSLHRDAVVKAARAKKHILCEKPIAATLEEADEMISAAQEAGVKLMIGHSKRFESTTRKLKELLSEGHIGKVFLAAAVFEYYPEMAGREWMTKGDKSGGGVLINSGIHKVDILRHLLGEVESVGAFSSTVREDFEVEDSIVVILKFTSGALGEIRTSFAAKDILKPCSELRFCGKEGTIKVKNTEVVVYSEKIYPGSPNAVNFPVGFGDGIEEEIRQFVDCIVEDKPSPVSGEDGKENLRVVLAAYQSVKEKGIINL